MANLAGNGWEVLIIKESCQLALLNSLSWSPGHSRSGSNGSWQAKPVLLFFRSNPESSLPCPFILACQGLLLILEASLPFPRATGYGSVTGHTLQGLTQTATCAICSDNQPLLLQFSLFMEWCHLGKEIFSWGEYNIHADKRLSAGNQEQCNFSGHSKMCPWTHLSLMGSIYLTILVAKMPLRYMISP